MSDPEVVVVPDSEDGFDAIGLRVEADVDAGGWHSNDDSPTHLFWLYERHTQLGPAIAISQPDVDRRLMAIHPVPLLDGLARLMTVVDPTLVGLVVVVEAWMVIIDPADRAGSAAMLAAAEERQLRNHAHRVECRQAHLRMLYGVERLITRVRGAEPTVRTTLGVGLLPETMRTFTSTLLHRQAPDRPGGTFRVDLPRP